ncbi:MAG: TonB-dependent receptor domain-containing protein [Bryobacteraceae bacterium]
MLTCSIPLAAQDPRGTIVGKVADVSGAVIPGAKVHAVNAETGVTVSGETNAAGQYEIPYLVPGTYRLDADSAGFKRWSRPGIELRTGDRIQIDVQMTIGEVTETVEVTAAAPVLESATSTMAQVMTSEEASNLPQRGGNLAWIYGLSPGVIVPSLPAGGPWNVDQSSALSVAGSGDRGLDFSVDGVSNNAYEGNTAFTPPPDMVQEVRLQTATYDASIGHTTGGSLSISLKSGTNEMRGSAGAAGAWGPLLTRNFFTNKWIFDPQTGPVTDEKIKSRTPEENWKKYSVAVGGPLAIPKLYNGRNRTFWMFGYQGHNRKQPVAQLVSVPTEAQRKGDFSALLALGAEYQIYDPHTTRASGSRLQRNPLPGNIVPASRIDPIGQKLVNYYPMPNTAGTPDGLSNYNIETPKDQIMHQPVVRIDHNFSEKHRLFARYSHSDFTGHFDKYDPKTDVRGRERKRPHRGAALDNVFVLSPETVLDVRYGFTWFSEVQSFLNQGWDIGEFFNKNLVGQLDPEGVTFPQITSRGMLQLGNDGGYDRTYYTHSLLSTLTWVKGDHSVKFGADLRLNLENNKTFGNVSPNLEFNETYTRGPLDNSTAAPVGQGIASMLFGLPDGGVVNVNDSRAESTRFYSFFVQDDWRATRNLTVNLGLRWEYEDPLTERYNRGTRDFDFTTVNPIQPAARAAYAKSPIPEVPVNQFNTIGGVTFLGLGGNPRGLRDPDYRALMPRVGFAYQINPRTVARAGYGLFFGMLGSEFYNTAMPGYNQNTSVVASVDNGISYVGSIANPLPFGIVRPQGAAGGLRTYLGRAPGFASSDGRRPYTQRWSASLQFQPFSRGVVEIGYLGSKTVRARVDTAFNSLPRQYLSTSPARDQATIDYLTAKVNNPFAGLEGFEGSTLATAKTVNRSQLLTAYPHFGGLSTALPAGSAWYNGLTARVERRMTGGLQFRASYTWSKNLEATGYLEPTDPRPEHVVANLDRPHRFVASAVYELPFGRGKPVFNGAGGVLDRIAGGWQVQAIYQIQSGPPLSWGNVIYYGNDWRAIELSTSHASLDRWFDTSQFERSSQRQLGSNIRTFPSRISFLRGDGINLWDVSLFKSIRLRESLKLQLRAEAENIANHPMFSAPNTNPANSNFGKVLGTQEGEGARRVFLGLKAIF